MNDYDCRQLRLMLMQISAYETGKVDLSGLISNLEVLHHVLQEVPESWLDKFWSEWGILEEVYSIAIVREQPIESPANRAETIPAIARIKEMVVEILTTASPQEDVE
jgi:hypothetical protein